MNCLKSCMLFYLAATSMLVAGCGTSETTVIQPQTYELNEQEQANRERAEKALAEQQQ
ncbi:MAG: hypothetical protein KDB00_09390 [Planctomycetales bacterium]|nr:hypothetical protein [Planctomycetales bacterium]